MQVLARVAVQAWVAAVLVLSGFTASAHGQTQTLRIVSYNIEDDISGKSTPSPGLIIPSGGGTTTQGGSLEGIGEEPLGPNNHVQPLDIVTLQETTSNSVTIAPIVAGLNAYYGISGMYAQSTVQATQNGGNTGGNGPNGIVYNTLTLQLVESHGGPTPTGSGGNGMPRQFMRYEFAPAGVTPTADNVFYVYVSHMKSGTGASDINARSLEAQALRTDSATLPSTARVLYTGDLNVSNSSEASYQTLVAAGINAGMDPFNDTGATGVFWDGNSLLDKKTESSDNLRYRDDYLLMSSNIYNGTAGGLQYISGTYHTFGNNGTTARFGTVNSAGNTALANVVQDGGTFISQSQLLSDLVGAADHLPVVADFLLPVPEPSTVVLVATGGLLLAARRARMRRNR